MSIYIKPTKAADSRTAEGEVTKEELFNVSKQHIGDVQKGLAFFSGKLYEAGLMHDHTKLDFIDSFYDAFKNHSDNFKEQPWYKLHVTTERHHLRDHIPEDVTLIDILERISDISMAAMGRTGGQVYMDMLPSEIWEKAYVNTIGLLLREIEVV